MSIEKDLYKDMGHFIHTGPNQEQYKYTST